MRWNTLLIVAAVTAVQPATIPPNNPWVTDYSSDGFYKASTELSSDYEYFRPEAPFTVPGQIIPGVSVGDIINTLGGVWNANNLVDGVQLVCDQYGSVVDSYLQQVSGGYGPSVDIVCYPVETSEIEEGCGTIWDLATESSYQYRDIGDGSISLIPFLNCRERDTVDYPNFSSDSYTGNFSTYYPMIVEAEKDAIEAMGDFNPYDPCDESTSKRLNNILFALMDWLGPSVGASIYGGIEPYSVCGILRYILSMDTIDYVLGEISVLKYLAADILEYLNKFDPCKLSQLGIDDLGPVRIIKDLLVEYSDLSETEFCDFLSNTQTREAYLQRGEIMITNIAFTLTNEDRCNNVMAIIARLDEEGLHVQYIGYNLGDESERSEFCRLSAEAFSPFSSYVPEPYKLPPGVELDDLQPFQTQGEFIPGLTIIDLLNIDGAIYRSPKIIDGFGVLCTVFEDFISEAIPQDIFDFDQICTEIKDRDTESLENLCLTFLVPNTYSSNHPIGLKRIEPISATIYGIRQLTGINDISKKEICTAADQLFNELSLKDVVESCLDFFIAEVLPSVHGLCQNWEESWCYWRPYCPEPEQPTEAATEEPRTSFYYYHYIPYVPSPEEIERFHSNFNQGMSAVVALVLGVTGYDSRDGLCEFAAEAIDPLSGRADVAFAKSLRSIILDLLTDVTRCSTLIDTMVRFLPEDFLNDGNTNIIYQFTGFYTSQSFCEEIERSFKTSAVTDSPEPVSDMMPNGKPVASFDIFAKVVVFAHRVARSI